MTNMFDLWNRITAWVGGLIRRYEMSYPLISISTLNIGAFKGPRCTIGGIIKSVTRETDGDFHIRITDGSYEAVTEVVPEIPLTIPPVGARVRVSGIPRQDADHGWWEIHPVTGIQVMM